MDTRLNLDNVEKDVYKSFWDDGLLDLFLGTGLVAAGILWLSDLIIFAALVPVMLMFLWAPIRNRLVLPRSGFVRFSTERQVRSRIGLNVAALTGLGFLTLFGAIVVIIRSDASVDQGWSEIIAPAIPSFIVAFALLLSKLGFGIPRLGIHAGIVATAGFAGMLTTLDPGWQFVISGIVIALVGSALLARLFRLEPISETEDGQAG